MTMSGFEVIDVFNPVMEESKNFTQSPSPPGLPLLL